MGVARETAAHTATPVAARARMVTSTKVTRTMLRCLHEAESGTELPSVATMSSRVRTHDARRRPYLLVCQPECRAGVDPRPGCGRVGPETAGVVIPDVRLDAGYGTGVPWASTNVVNGSSTFS